MVLAVGALVLLVTITAVAMFWLAPAALSARWLALVFGSAGAGHRIGATGGDRPGRPLYLSESDRFIDCGGLERVDVLSAPAGSPTNALAALDAGGGIRRDGACAGRLGVASNFLLAQC